MQLWGFLTKGQTTEECPLLRVPLGSEGTTRCAGVGPAQLRYHHNNSSIVAHFGVIDWRSVLS